MRSDRELRTQVAPVDLEGLPVLHEILGLLNDPAVSAAQLGRAADRFPVLAHRLRYRTHNASRSGSPRKTAGEAIVLLGNRGFEAVLLELLEDLTVLRAELGPEGQLPEMTLERGDL